MRIEGGELIFHISYFEVFHISEISYKLQTNTSKYLIG